MVSVLTVFLMACSSKDSDSLPVYEDIPSFSLTDQMGHAFTREDLQGKVVLANFIFTNCTQFCPTLSPRMAQVQEKLEEDGLLGNEVLLLSFSVDPEHDTPEILLSYAERYGANHNAWRFLTGPPEVMRQVITDGLKLAFDQVDGNDKVKCGCDRGHPQDRQAQHVKLHTKAGVKLICRYGSVGKPSRIGRPSQEPTRL